MKPTFRILLILLSVSSLFAENITCANALQATTAEIIRPNPNAILRTAQTIFIRTKTGYFEPAALEQALLDRHEFQKWGFVITRDETDAELIIEVDRKLFTKRFVYSVIDPRTKRVLLGGKFGSLGGTVEGQIADGFIKRLKRIRPLGT